MEKKKKVSFSYDQGRKKGEDTLTSTPPEGGKKKGRDLICDHPGGSRKGGRGSLA